MIEKKENGGPAFPIPGSGMFSGMDLRDYFAAKAMQTFLANKKPHETDQTFSAWASDAYEMADAMLKARHD